MIILSRRIVVNGIEWNSKEFKYREYEVHLLPDFGDIKWVIFPFVITYVIGLNAKLLMTFKHKTKV
jgi:hypothetical protein